MNRPVTSPQPEELERRLPWLLVFRAGVATAILLLTLVADLSGAPVRTMLGLLYGVAIVSYLVVFVLGLLLRGGVTAVGLTAAHLVAALFAAAVAVHATGGVGSVLSFLYLLVILDGAIAGGGRVALTVAATAAMVYGGQLVVQMYGWIPAGGDEPGSVGYTSTALAHFVAFFSTAWLGGYLAEQGQRARKQASKARRTLRNIEALQRRVFDALPVGVLTLDEEGWVVAANHRASTLLMRDLKDLLGGKVPEPLSAILQRGEPYVEHALTLNGTTRQLGILVASMELHEEGAGLRVMVLEDRTQIRRLEDALADRRRLASLGELAGAIAHEIRNPLAAISGAAELLGTEDSDETTRIRLQDIVLREVERLDRLVGDFLMYARPLAPRRARTDISVLLMDACEALREDPQVASFPIEMGFPADLEAMVDADQVGQVVSNLLRNAVQASDPGQRVRLEGSAEGRDLMVKVVDEGPGLPDSIRAHLFEPFQTTRRGATGLGLAVAQRIMDGHGGSISIDSEPGVGTEVKVHFPDAVIVDPTEISGGAPNPTPEDRLEGLDPGRHLG